MLSLSRKHLVVAVAFAPLPLLAQSKSAHTAAHAADVRTAVAVVASDQSPSDSAATIIARDLENGDMLRVVSGSSASLTVRAMPSTQGLEVTLADRNGNVKHQREFPLPSTEAPRDAAIADSLDRALAATVAQRQLALVRAAAFRDSLRGEMAKKPPRLRNNKERQEFASIVAKRDTLLANATAQDEVIRSAERADSANRDAMLKYLVARDRYVRDSVAGARRWAMHGVSDEVAEWITGQRGVAQSRVAYISNGQVRIVDFDGANDHAVTQGGRPMSPSWRRDGRAIVFSDMTDAGTQIAWVDLSTGSVRQLDAARKGLNITPVFGSDDHSIVFAKGDDNSTSLVSLAVDGSAQPRTVGARGRYDESSPALSPDGMRVAYVSPRPKTPQIYSSNLDGSDERLETPANTPGRIYRTGPDWSPDGKMIAFEQQNGDFQVWVVNRADHKLRKLTSYRENEDPTWAPDSRHLALTSTRSGSKAIWMLDVQTGRWRQLTQAGDARLASFSSRIGAMLPDVARAPAYPTMVATVGKR